MDQLALSIIGPDTPPTPIPLPWGVQHLSGPNVLDTIIQKGLLIAWIGTIVLAVFFLILAGISFMTSAGDKQKITTAKNQLTYSVIGLVLAFLAIFIVNVIGYFFGITFFGAK